MFEPDRFSESRPKFVPVDRDQALAATTLLAETYQIPLKPRCTVRAPFGLEINSTNFLISSGSIRVILKQIPAHRATAHEASCLIASQLSTPTAKPIASLAGTFVARAGDGAFSLWNFVEGQYFRGGQEQLNDVGYQIGRLSQELGALHSVAPKGVRPSPSYHATIEVLSRLLAILTSQRGLPKHELPAALLRSVPDLQDAMCSIAKWPEDQRESKQLVHFDLHPHNILTSNNKVVAILDLDSVLLYPPSQALGFALVKLFRQHLSLGQKPFSPRKTREDVLALAASISPTIRIEDLLVGAQVEICRRIALITSEILTKGWSEWQGVLDIQLRTLSETRWLQKLFS